MIIQEVINNTTGSPIMFDMRLVIGKSSFKRSGLQGVGSTINFKTRLANYKSHIKHNRRTCGIVNHFLDNHNADHSLLKFMLIDQRHGNLRECENFWIGMLLTNQRGLNFTHDFVQQ